MKVSIGHLTYSVARVPVDTCATIYGTMGTTHKLKGTITLYEGMSPQEEASTLLHELVHAVWHAYHLPDEVKEEEACTLLEGPLMALMADNPQVVAGIIAARGGARLVLS